ncbi:Flp family type IVb pilin [Breoghania sp.]|uniref:Flp family type IVb pilin n=1 Tax=Breoghania sp. TaxID=2065378 RepID=UPI0029CA5DE3|nr:Flp family type IVb pilin [Breoghania sp.]
MSLSPAKNGMFRIRRVFSAFLSDERGSTAIEYSLIASIIVLAIIGSLTALGTSLRDDFYEPVAVGLAGGN